MTLEIGADLTVGHRQTAREVVLEVLREAILGGRLQGGTRLLQSEIAKQLGVSTTPVREAMRDLVTDGLIRMDPYKGAVVAEATLEEAQEIYELRLLLEPVAVRRVIAAISDEALRRAGEIELRASAETDPGKWVELNRRFHDALMTEGLSPRLSSFLKNLRDAAAIHVGRSILLDDERIPDANEDHRKILDAFRRRDVDEAIRLTEAHLRATLEAFPPAEAMHKDSWRRETGESCD